MPKSIILGISQRRAFRRLVENSRERLYRMAYAWTHDPHLADDLVQQALYKALNNYKQLKDMGAAEAWLFRILSNCLKDHYRAKRDLVSSDDCIIADEITPEHRTEKQQLATKVRSAVKTLPMAQRQVVTLVDLEGFTYAAVAEVLDIPVGTVMSRLCRGRRALKDHLIDVGAAMESRRSTPLKRVK
jgi:RNA polymerase sigma-70 factor (ECF subfamily)